MNPPEKKADDVAIQIKATNDESSVVPKADAASKGKGGGAMSVWGIGPSPFIWGVHFHVIASSVLVLVWSIYYRGGLNWNAVNKNLVFNIHPVLMVIGFFLVSSEAILVYKSVPGTKIFLKKVHLSLQAIAFVLGIFGISAALKYHNAMKIDNFYSLHSWLGLGAMALFAIQWIAGFVTFWYPGAANNTRKSVLPWHIFFGAFIYTLVIAAALTGILEKLTFLQSAKAFGHYAPEAYLANFLGIAITLVGVCTILAAVIPKHPVEEGYRALE